MSYGRIPLLYQSSAGGEGAEVIYALRNNEKLSQKILNSLASSGQIIRKYYQKRSTSNANKDYYFMLRDTSPYEAVIVEYGFLDNVKDANKLKNNYKEYALDVVDAVLNYKGIIPDNIEFYIVKKGDTLYSIAKKYGMSVDKLMSINNLNNTNLSIGQTLLVKEKNIDKTPNIISSNVYIVQAGDTLYSIAKKYNTTVDKLKDLNNLASNLISVNQKLLLPSNNYYIVQAGDTLYSIAKKNNTTVDKIKEINKLNSNLISINQKLLLP